MLTDIYLYEQQKKYAHEFTAYGIYSASVPPLKMALRYNKNSLRTGEKL
jgi:hypothetical protein